MLTIYSWYNLTRFIVGRWKISASHNMILSEDHTSFTACKVIFIIHFSTAETKQTGTLSKKNWVCLFFFFILIAFYIPEAEFCLLLWTSWLFPDCQLTILPDFTSSLKALHHFLRELFPISICKRWDHKPLIQSTYSSKDNREDKHPLHPHLWYLSCYIGLRPL